MLFDGAMKVEKYVFDSLPSTNLMLKKLNLNSVNLVKKKFTDNYYHVELKDD